LPRRGERSEHGSMELVKEKAKYGERKVKKEVF
jgi:hypothetical protein